MLNFAGALMGRLAYEFTLCARFSIHFLPRLHTSFVLILMRCNLLVAIQFRVAFRAGEPVFA